MDIGIDPNQDLIYEGRSQYGRAIWPIPIVSPAKIVFASDGPLAAEKSADSITSACRFREDFFDAISRIRRGRFYFAGGTQPTSWHVEPHPALPVESVKYAGHNLRKDLNTFHGNSIWQKYLNERHEQPLVLLGIDQRFTIWTIINVEIISTGEELVTLKSRSGLGILPVIDNNKIPESFRAHTQETLRALSDEVYRSAPISVIDRARDAASQILLAYFKLAGREAEDLAKLASKLESEEKEKLIAANAAKILARLHARAKPVERERRIMRQIREQDAELATQLVGTILCEIGWAEWA